MVKNENELEDADMRDVVPVPVITNFTLTNTVQGKISSLNLLDCRCS